MTNKGPWQLEVQDEPGRSVELPQKGMLVLGSSDDRAGLVLTGPGVDGAHCAIGQVKDGGWAIKDLGSQRGTFVNGERISSTRLAAGDVVAVGGSSLRVIDPAAPPADTLAETKVGPRETADAPRESGDAPGKPALERLGGFRIERRLGRGGMGEVLLAVQESLSRPVALKVLAAKFASDADFVRRFHSEARAAAALSHPNVVVVHDVGEADGRHFLAMEYMPGGNLEERVAREGRLAWREVLDVLHDAAAGLTYAEAQGILHRDIKPANLMVAASGSVKIADLGLATPVDEQDADQKTFGTPHFISPEQARGEAVDHRSDLYSLGATAYRLLTGHTPFGGSTAAEIVRARFSEDPSPLRHQVPTIPPELEDLVLRLMEREAENRFPSADALLREVDRIRLQADHGTEPAVAPGASSRLPLLLGGVAVLVAAIAGWALLGGTADDPLADDGRRDPGGTVAASGTDSPGTGASDPEIDEGTFFGDPGGEDTTESDDLDQRLRALELEAKGAYSEIPADYSTEDRIGALEDLIERYGPTSVAATARSEIERLRAGETAAQIAAESRSRDVAESVRRLGTAAGWPPRALGPDDPVPAPWQIVSSIQGYQVSTAMISDPEFLAQRGALIDEVLRAAADRATRALASADALAEQGSFDEIAGVLAPFEKELALPDPELGEPSGYAALRTLALELTARLAGLERERALHVARVATRDRVELARALGPSTTSTVELRALQLDAPIARLTAIAATLATPDARVVAEQAGGRLTRARDALLLLVASHDARQWRRDTVGVPSGRRSTPRETLGARPGGLLVGGDGGQELVPWETFATDPESLLRLFRGRLSRDYTAPEEAAILSLLTVNAVQHALAPALASLGAEGAGGRSLFRPQDTETMQRAFDAAVDWASAAESSLGPARLELEREREAAGILADALAASEESAWTRAVARLETLFGDYGDTLLVLQLSDGSLPVEPDLPAEPEVVAAPDNGDANGDASDGPGESEDG